MTVLGLLGFIAMAILTLVVGGAGAFSIYRWLWVWRKQ